MRPTPLYLLRRLGWTLLLIFGTTTVAFFLANVLPGDPARMLVGPQASAKDVENVRRAYGLDRPITERYVRSMSRLIHLGPREIPKRAPEHRSCASLGLGVHVDLGYSFHYHRPVVELLAKKIPRSIELGLAALLIQLLVGTGLGAMAAQRPGTRFDEGLMAMSLLGVSVPTFLSGLILQYIFAYKLRLLPYDGYGASAAEHLTSLILPALTLGIFGTAFYARLAREELGVLLRQDFVRTARAKGASRLRALVVHAMRPALVPLATVAALDLGAMVGGAMITEKLFRWPGVGELAVEALLNRDGPVIFGTVLSASAGVVIAAFLMDLAYVLLDPRIAERGQA